MTVRHVYDALGPSTRTPGLPAFSPQTGPCGSPLESSTWNQLLAQLGITISIERPLRFVATTSTAIGSPSAATDRPSVTSIVSSWIGSVVALHALTTSIVEAAAATIPWAGSRESLMGECID